MTRIYNNFESPRGTDPYFSRNVVRQIVLLAILLEYLLTVKVTGSNLQSPCKRSGWNDAMLCCRKLGPSYSLPLISTQTDYGNLVSIMKKNDMNNIWLQLKRVRYRKFTWMDGLPGPNSLNTVSNSTNCGKWNFKRDEIMAGNCGNYVEKGVLCHVTDCPGCLHIDLSSTSECVQDENNCYIKDCTSITWDGGRHFCLEHSAEYLSLGTPEKVEAFRNASSFKTRNCLGAWIGLRRHQWTFIFNMTDRYDVTLPYWLPGEPVAFGDCGYMKKHKHGYGWAATSCNRKLDVLCLPNNATIENKTESSIVRNETFGCQPCINGSSLCEYTPGYIDMLHTLPAILAICVLIGLLLVIFVIFYCWRKRRSRKRKLKKDLSGALKVQGGEGPVESHALLEIGI